MALVANIFKIRLQILCNGTKVVWFNNQTFLCQLSVNFELKRNTFVEYVKSLWKDSVGAFQAEVDQLFYIYPYLYISKCSQYRESTQANLVFLFAVVAERM